MKCSLCVILLEINFKQNFGYFSIISINSQNNLTLFFQPRTSPFPSYIDPSYMKYGLKYSILAPLAGYFWSVVLVPDSGIAE